MYYDTIIKKYIAFALGVCARVNFGILANSARKGGKSLAKMTNENNS